MDQNQQHDGESADNRGPPSDNDAHLASDVLLGAKKIAAHISSLLGVYVDESDVYYAHRMGKWPIGKYGAFLIASRRRLTRHRDELTRGPPQPKDPTSDSEARG